MASALVWRRRFDLAREALLDVGAVRSVSDQLAATAADRGARLIVLTGMASLPAARRVGVFMGSFNPLTIAHTGAVEAARAALRLDAVIWGVPWVSVNKERVERALLADRVVQMRALLASSSPTDTLGIFKSGLYARQAEVVRAELASTAELWFLVGFDKVAQIFDPRFYEDRESALRDLFASTRLAVVPRDGQSVNALRRLLDVESNRAYAVRVDYLDIAPELATISSSAARHTVARLGDPETVDPEALAGVLAPEGAALALVTGAYSPPTLLADGRLVDRYAAREEALATPLVNDSMRHTDGPQLTPEDEMRGERKN